MADVIGILGFSLHAAHKIYDIVKSIKDAPDEIEALKTQTKRVEYFANFIDGLQVGDQVLSEATTTQFRTLATQAEKLTKSTDGLLKKAMSKTANGDAEVKRLNVKWPLYASHAKKLAEDFKQLNMELGTILTVHSS